MTFEEVTLRNKTIEKDDRLDWSSAIDPSALRDTEKRYGSYRLGKKRRRDREARTRIHTVARRFHIS